MWCKAVVRVTPLPGFIEAPISSVDIHISPSDIAGKHPLIRVGDLDVGPEMLDGRMHLSGEVAHLRPVAGGGGGLQSRRRLRQRQCADHPRRALDPVRLRSEEHTSELQSLMRISYAVFCLKKKKNK